MQLDDRRDLLDEIRWETWQGEAATLVFLVRKGRVLLIRKKRGLGAGKINGPGGRVEPDETLLACALREVREELCISPHALAPRGELRFQFADGYAIHVHVFTGTDFSGEPRETEEAAPLWFPVDALPLDEMWVDDRLWLSAVLAGRTVQGRFLFDGDRMLAHDLRLMDQSQGEDPAADPGGGPGMR